MSRSDSFPLKGTVFSGDFSMIAALPSLEEPINIDSETNVFRFFAMAKASSIVDAYCSISLVRMEIGGTCWNSRLGGIDRDGQPRFVHTG